MRRSLALLLVALGCGDGEGRDQPPQVPEDPAAPEAPSIHWVSAQAPGWDVQVYVPEPWTKDYKTDGDQIFFAGPDADAGWRPELQFGWRMKEKSLEAWAGERIRHLETLPGGRVISKAPGTVAGMSAVQFVYAFEKGEQGAQLMREINFYFAGHGCIGFVRGVCTARTYDKYLPVFRGAAARLRYNPQ